MHTFLLSDLHLSLDNPNVIAAFLNFLSKQAPSAESIYILGDLFEYWIGDDGVEHIGALEILHAMQALSKKLPCFFIPGNRDFLVRDCFSERSGFTLLADETVIDLYGVPTLILHGDSLCTADTKHQQFRTNFVSNKMVCDLLLAKPLKERIALAKEARSKSQTKNNNMNDKIMDVTESAVLDAFRKHQVTQMIHGHTHRQAVHKHHFDGIARYRYVLGDWHKTSSILIANAEGLEIINAEIV